MKSELSIEYSTSTGERESRPFREEPWHLHYVSWSSMHSMHSALRHANPRSWSGVFNLLKFDLTPKKKKSKFHRMNYAGHVRHRISELL